ncbi:MAG: ATP-binding cassette domain-containing protein [Gemmatimonadetes bacterium]|nr:ATP-binding cassette domain-containing protein [Gemmatimonadota bacterium]
MSPQPEAAAPFVACRGVSVRVEGGQYAVRDLTLDVMAGETLVLLGRSGSGKTTTLKLMNGLRLPTSGEVTVDGRATSAWEPHRLRRRIGYVIQEVGLFPHFTVERNVALVPSLEGWEPGRIRGRVEELLVLVGLEPKRFRGRYPHELSGGQRQRVGIARALAADPPLLLLDEPFGALDPLTRAELQREFRDLSTRLGKTTVFVTHDVREAMALASRLALLAEGGIAFLGAPETLRGATHPEARAFAEVLDA